MERPVLSQLLRIFTTSLISEAKQLSKKAALCSMELKPKIHTTSFSSIVPPDKHCNDKCSNSCRAFRIAPLAYLASTPAASSEIVISFFFATLRTCSFTSSSGIFPNTYTGALDTIVSGNDSFSVVHKIKIQCAGGFSKVINKALKAAFDNIWASSITIIFLEYIPMVDA